MAVVSLSPEEAFVLKNWPNRLERTARPADFQDTVTGDWVEVKQGELSPAQLGAFLQSFNNGGHPKLALVRRSRIFVLELVKVI